MNTWSVEKIQEFYTYLNEYFGLSVNPQIKLGEKNSASEGFKRSRAIMSSKINFNVSLLGNSCNSFNLVSCKSILFVLQDTCRAAG